MTPRRWSKATGPISASICSVLEAGWKPSSSGFLQSPDASATFDGALFNKAQIVDSFSRDMEEAVVETSCLSLSRCWHGERHHNRKGAKHQLIKEKNFMAVLALDFLVLWSYR